MIFSAEIEASLAGLSAPQRAWALAKAAYETAHERNFAEQRAAMAQATADDPEPVDSWRDDRWTEWYDRNKARIEKATASIAARYPSELQRLMELAERNMVEWAKERVQAQFPHHFEEFKVAWERYEQNELYGDMRKKFITICFQTPA